MKNLSTLLLVFFMTFANCLSQNTSSEELSLILTGNDSVEIIINNSSKFFRKINYDYKDNTLIINCKTSHIGRIVFFGSKNFSNHIALRPNTAFIIMNKTKYCIIYDIKSHIWKLEKSQYQLEFENKG